MAGQPGGLPPMIGVGGLTAPRPPYGNHLEVTMSLNLGRIAGALAAAAVLASPLAASASDGFGMISPDRVEKLLGTPDVKVFDVNVDELWQKHHLPGAVHVGERELAPLLPKDKTTRLVFYCSGPK